MFKAEEKEEARMYMGEMWYKGDQPAETEEEQATGCISEGRLISFLFNDVILSNTLCENLINKGYETGAVNELVSAYDDETENYVEEFQFFVVNLALTEETTIDIIKKSGRPLFLRYDNDNDIYILSVGDLGTNRYYIASDIKRAASYEDDNIFNLQ